MRESRGAYTIVDIIQSSLFFRRMITAHKKEPTDTAISKYVSAIFFPSNDWPSPEHCVFNMANDNNILLSLLNVMHPVLII